MAELNPTLFWPKDHLLEFPELLEAGQDPTEAQLDKIADVILREFNDTSLDLLTKVSGSGNRVVAGIVTLVTTGLTVGVTTIQFAVTLSSTNYSVFMVPLSNTSPGNTAVSRYGYKNKTTSSVDLEAQMGTNQSLPVAWIIVY